MLDGIGLADAVVLKLYGPPYQALGWTVTRRSWRFVQVRFEGG
jgi:hypothetical protein